MRAHNSYIQPTRRSRHRRIPVLMGGRFLPSNIAGLQLWLDANDTSTLFQDAAKTTPAGDGDVVGAWEDKSGNGRDATQATTANKPTLDTDVLLSGFPGLLFDAADDWLSYAKFGLNAVTYYAVITGVDNAVAINRVLDAQNDGANPYRHIFDFDHVANNWEINFRATGVLVGSSDPAGKHVFAIGATETITATGYVDSVTTIDAGPLAIVGAWAADSAAASRIGFAINNASPFNGYIHSLLIYNTEHNATQRAQVVEYLANRYEVTLS